MSEFLIEVTDVFFVKEESNWFIGSCKAVADPEHDRPLDFAGSMKISGVFNSLNEGIPYRIEGEIVKHQGKDQIKIARGCTPERIERLINLTGIERYFLWIKKGLDAKRKADKKPSLKIGGVKLEAVVRQYGKESLAIARTDPKRVSKEVKGWSIEQAQAFAKELNEHLKDEETLLELSTLGANGALSPAQQEELFTEHKRGAPNIVRTDPYKMIQWLRGFGWEKADTLALQNLGWPMSAPSRLDAGLHEVLRDQSSKGHVWTYYHSAVNSAANKARQSVEFHKSLIRIDDGVCVVPGSSRTRLYLKKLRNAELSVASFMKNTSASRTSDSLDQFSDLSKSLNELQKEAFKLALSGGVNILTGGPGRGKTHTCRAIIEALLCLNKIFHLLAPTGRAAARATELTGVRSETIHRYLMRTQDEGHEEANFFIIDESSMIDLELMARFLKSCRPGQSVLFVGDSDQLPPVGPGKPFVDLINSKRVPTVELTQIMRTDRRGIIDAAEIVNTGRKNPGEALKAIQCESFRWLNAEKQAAQNLAVEVVEELLEDGAAADDIQVIVARNGYKSSNPLCLSDRALNKRLSPILNSSGQAILAWGRGDQLSIGDRVMNLKNQTGLEIYSEKRGRQNKKASVMNGEVGKVIGLGKNGSGHPVVVCDFGFDGDDKTARILAWSARKNELVQAYAATCHKFQGSESKHIVVVLDKSSGQLCDRSWLYTAITRASHSVVLIAPDEVIVKAIRRPAKVTERRSGLPELLNNSPLLAAS